MPMSIFARITIEIRNIWWVSKFKETIIIMKLGILGLFAGNSSGGAYRGSRETGNWRLR
jgi:hypothetical protein